MSLLNRLRSALGAAGTESTAAALEEALAAHEAGRLDEAERGYKAILARDDRNADARHLMGLIAHQRGDQAAALAHIRRAIAIDSATALFHFNLGNVLTALGEHEEAAAAFSRALEIGPERFDFCFNLGQAEAARGRDAAAAAAFRRALALEPASEAARHELARALVAQSDREQGKAQLYDEAIDLLAEHWQLGADPTASRIALAHALECRERFSEALDHYRGVIEARPEAAPAHWGMGNCHNRLGRMDEAVRCYRAALALDPEDANIASAIASGLIYDENCPPQALLDEHRRWSERYAARYAPRAPVRVRAPDRERRLRVGYLSPDFRRHPVTALFLPLIERHDPQAVEIFCYHNFPGADAVTERVCRASHHWRQVASLADAELARQIEADGIDILADLSGHTSYQRLLALARRPAPLQVSWLGYFASTGVEAIDYFVTDRHSSPPGQDRYFTEKLVRLPDTRFCFQPTLAMPEANEPPSGASGRVTFGCCNNLAKVGPRVLALWSKILAAVPGSLLYLQAGALNDSANRERFLSHAVRCGIPADRLELRPFVPIEQAALAYHAIDIALDPFPFCGGMTSFEALWMGIPVVTFEQELVAGRQTASMLANLGLGDLVALDESAYVDIACALARDSARLAELRRTLRSRFLASPLADYAKFTRALESAYRLMWYTLVAGGPKEPINL